MSIENLKSTIQAYDDAKAKAIEEAQRSLSVAFIAAAADLPEEYRGFVWTQYTPSFNDGEPCVFSVNDWELLSAGDGEGEIEDEEGIYVYGELAEQPFVQAISALFNMVPEEFFQEIYGESAKVIVTRKEVTVEEYECGY